MKQKLILTCLTALLAIVGGVALFIQGNMLWIYTIVTSSLLALVALGGALQYTSREYEDFRDIYREKDRMQKEKIRVLTEALIQEQKKQIIEQQTPKLSTEEEQCITVAIDSKLQ